MITSDNNFRNLLFLSILRKSYIFVKLEECAEFAQLYESYFLIPPRYYDTIDVNTTCIAVNAIFIKHVCSLSELSEEEPKLKHPYKELQEEVDTTPNVLNSFFELYQEKGLYIIGIKNNEKA